MNNYLDNLIENLINNKTFNCKKTLRLNDFLYEYKGITLIEYMLKYNVKYYYALVPNLKDNINIIKIFLKYNKFNLLGFIKTNTYLMKINDIPLIEYLLQNNINFEINTLDFNIELINILIKYNRYDLIKKVNINDNNLEEALKLNIIDYVNIGIINYDILDLLKKYNRYDLLEKLEFSENILSNGLLEKIINLGYIPKINNCSFDIINKLYKLNKPEYIINYFNYNNINYLFKLIDKNTLLIDYLLKYNLDFRNIGLYSDTLEEEHRVLVYLKFSKCSKSEFLYKLDKEELLKRNKKGTCLLDTFIKLDLNETINILKNYYLINDLDIIMYLRTKNINIKGNQIDISNYKSSDKINIDLIDYNNLDEENLDLLIKLEEVFSTTDKDLLNTLILSYSKCLNRKDIFIKDEIKSLIEIKENNPELTINKGDYSYFNDIDGLFLKDDDINTLNHELGHLLHYYLRKDEVPSEFIKIINNIKNKSNFIEKVKEFSIKYNKLEDNIYKTVNDKYDTWKIEYYTKEKLEEIKKFINSSKNEKINEYIKLGYKKEDLEQVLDEYYKLDKYLESDKRIRCNENTERIMARDYSEIRAISDIIDAVSSGLYYDNKLYDKDNNKIEGTFGHGIMYYYDINKIFQEIFANYCLIIKSDKKDISLKYLEKLLGNEIITCLEEFYNNSIYNKEVKYARL